MHCFWIKISTLFLNTNSCSLVLSSDKSCYNLSIDSENKQNWSSESKSTRQLFISQNNPVEDGSEIWKMIIPLSM